MITTHVLDTAQGRPAAGVAVTLEKRERDGWLEIGRGATDADGRLKTLWPSGTPLAAGTFRLRFDTSARSEFFPEVNIVFQVREGGGHFHVPLLLAPYGYSTYRGS
ncbi:MAG TPA: hydroxyisourate hydrolase [Myxococcales bacterium]|nr:hydroxyisourate hydrolase [Myxococcales bacterium]